MSPQGGMSGHVSMSIAKSQSGVGGVFAGTNLMLPRILTTSHSRVLWLTSGGPVYSGRKWNDRTDMRVFPELMCLFPFSEANRCTDTLIKEAKPVFSNAVNFSLKKQARVPASQKFCV